MFWWKSLTNIVKVAMILALLLFNINSLEAARPFEVMKSKFGAIKVSSVSKVRALVSPSAPNSSTYIPGNGN